MGFFGLLDPGTGDKNCYKKFQKHEDQITKLTQKVAELSIIGVGLNRRSITNEQWHEDHPNQCKDLFGFNNFKEFKVYLSCFWPDDFGTEESFQCFDDDAQPISTFEKCLITKMRFHRKLTLEHLSGIWNRHRTKIGQYILEWAPRWGAKGLELSILDLKDEYIW